MPVCILVRNIDSELHFFNDCIKIWILNLVQCIERSIHTYIIWNSCINISILKHNSSWNKFSYFLVLFDNLHSTYLIFSIFQVCSILNYYTCCVDMIIVVSDGSITNFWRSFCINYMKEEKKREAANEEHGRWLYWANNDLMRGRLEIPHVQK